MAAGVFGVDQRRRQQRLRALCAAALRSLGGDGQMHYRGPRLYQGEHPLSLYAPHLRLNDDDTDLDNQRAVADAVALRLRHHDAALHRRQIPASPPARLVFELLEQLRVETHAPPWLPGMIGNLQQRFERWSGEFHRSGLAQTSQGLLLYTLAQISRAQLTATPVLAATEALIEHTRGALAPVIGADLVGLRRQRHDQSAYAVHARRIADHLGAALEQAAGDQGRDSEDNDDENRHSRFTLLLDFDREADDGIARLTLEDGRTLDHDDTYRVFSAAYDDEKPITALVRAAQLKDFRAQLDRRISDQGFAVRRLACRFTAHFARPERQGWAFGQESGYLDGRRLSALVTSPGERHLFRREAEPPRRDGVVGFLIDCSGSMRGHGEAVAMLVDRLCTALDLAGVDSEILGFTSGAWNGGRAIKEWRRAGCPASPGRLNERRHLIIKSTETPWRRARHGLGGLLKADIYKEGLDGEALDWACQRLLRQDRQRRVLVVFSDGSPMDSATHQHNGPGYLDEHLRQVRQQHDRQGHIALRAVGVGLDLSPFYPHNLPVNLTGAVDNQTLDDIGGLIVGKGLGRG